MESHSRIRLPDVHCASATQFIDELSPYGDRFRDTSIREHWLFRGQCKDWPLIPSAMREKGKALADLTGRDLVAHGDRLQAQRDVLIQFFELADRRGLALPDDSQQLRKTLETLRSPRGDTYVPQAYDEWSTEGAALSLAALAQHYGVPTSLLDWTRIALVAAFFAAEGSLHSDDGKDDDLLVVWAFLFPNLGRQDALNVETDPIRVITAPTATNPNLRAQQGVFTRMNTQYCYDDAGSYRSLESVIADVDDFRSPPGSRLAAALSDCRLQKFTLPSGFTHDVLRLLVRADITPSSVRPGYHSIVDDLRLLKSIV